MPENNCQDCGKQFVAFMPTLLQRCLECEVVRLELQRDMARRVVVLTDEVIALLVRR